MSACSFVLSLFSCVFLFILYGSFYYSQRFSFLAPRRGSLIPFYALSTWQGIPGLPNLGVVNFFAYVFFFQSPCKRPKISHHSVHPGSTIVEGCNWEDVTPGPAAPVPLPEAVSKLAVKASVRDLRFKNPVCVRAGNIHNFITRREEVLTGQEKRAEILSYLRDGVDVNPFFAPYKGDFQGKFYDSPIPPNACFPNSKSCEEFTDFISSTISQRLANGSISVWGKVGECTPLYLVMPLTVEARKPKLCHDERFLNLWVKDSPFTLDYISNLPRYVGKDSFQTTMDDKSGYDHVRLAENSRKFFGLQWQGVYYLYHTIPLSGKPAHTFTTLLVWGPLVTSDLWACHVVDSELKQRTFFHDGGLHSVRGMDRERRLWRENF